MDSLPQPLPLNHPWNESLDLLTRSLARVGMRVMRTFDLREARGEVGAYPCPHHGAGECNCQLVILLAYGQAGRPATLIIHGSEEQTWLSLINSPIQPADPAIRAAIERALLGGLEE